MLIIERADDFHIDSDIFKFKITKGEEVINAHFLTHFTYGFGKPETLNPVTQAHHADYDLVLVLDRPIHGFTANDLLEHCIMLSDAVVAPNCYSHLSYDISLLEAVKIDCDLNVTRVLNGENT